MLSFCSVLEQLGGKQIVMQHLGHEDPNVRYEALLAVQKLMVHNWLVWHMRLFCLILPIALRCRSIPTPILFPKPLPNNYFQFPPNSIKIFCNYSKSNCVFIFLYSLPLKREYLGKQLEKENENQKQGAAPIAGKA